MHRNILRVELQRDFLATNRETLLIDFFDSKAATGRVAAPTAISKAQTDNRDMDRKKRFVCNMTLIPVLEGAGRRFRNRVLGQDPLPRWRAITYLFERIVS